MHEIDKTKLSDQTKYRLYEIKKENYLINEINERESYSKLLFHLQVLLVCLLE